MVETYVTDDVSLIPDAQIIFPRVFFKGITNLKHPNCMYNTCFELIEQHCNYSILPSSYTDFANLIIIKLYNFLKTIESEIRRARYKNLQKSDFLRRTTSRLQSINSFEKNLGDLLQFWSINKNFFWSLVAMDHTLAKKKITEIVLEKMRLFEGICNNHRVIFNKTDTGLSENLYMLIKEAKKNKSLKHSANDEDLLILSDCFIYKNTSCPGFLYLVTNDKELFGITKEIVEKPKIIFNDFKSTEKVIGFEPLKPEKLIASIQNQSKK